MMASYFLSRTLVPTMMHFLLGKEIGLYQDQGESEKEERRSFVWRWHMKFDRQFEKMQHHYKRLLEWCLDNAAITLCLFGLLVAVSLPMTFFIGKDFFPYVDSGQMKLHVNPPPGLRLEDSEQYFAGIEKEIRTQIPADQIDLILDNIGLPNSGINLAFGGEATISNSDGDILIALKPG
jgi:multidrug efflux pump subunit AcrB